MARVNIEQPRSSNDPLQSKIQWIEVPTVADSTQGIPLGLYSLGQLDRLIAQQETNMIQSI